MLSKLSKGPTTSTMKMDQKRRYYSFGPFPLDSTNLQKSNLFPIAKIFPNPIPLPFTLKMDNTMYVETLAHQQIHRLKLESRSYVCVLKEGQTNIRLFLYTSIPYISHKDRINALVCRAVARQWP
jgi:hypothetical protein